MRNLFLGDFTELHPFLSGIMWHHRVYLRIYVGVIHDLLYHNPWMFVTRHRGRHLSVIRS